jgi:creatinine amidohydrolase
VLAADGIVMTFTALQDIEAAGSKVRQQEGGSHADEIETSMILFMQPAAVDMKKAVKDYRPSVGSGLTRDPKSTTSTYSATGVWGDPTLATREKGRIATEALVAQILSDIEKLRGTSLPTKK